MKRGSDETDEAMKRGNEEAAVQNVWRFRFILEGLSLLGIFASSLPRFIALILLSPGKRL
jgi:hypothetical protein